VLLSEGQAALPLRGRRLLFIGGKGGVGKTTIAGALGLRAAAAGERVLIVSTDPAHSLGDLFDMPVGDRTREIRPGLHGLEVDPDVEVGRYLDQVQSNMRRFVRPAMYSEIQRQIALTRGSPGAVEAALMDRVADLMDRAGDEYDRVIFDTAPTGHTLRLLSLPEIMGAWTDGLLRSRERSDSFGRAVRRLTRSKSDATGGSEALVEASAAPRRQPASGDDLTWFDDTKEAPADERTQRIREVLLERRRKFSRARRLLLDPERTAFVLVLIPEKLPILESEKALRVLREHKVPVAGLVVNRVLPDAQLGTFLENRREQEKEYLARIDTLFGDLPRVRVPLLPQDVAGIGSLETVADALAHA
jgi:arsenite/tail-anchored protein-transporting ATPase